MTNYNNNIGFQVRAILCLCVMLFSMNSGAASGLDNFVISDSIKRKIADIPSNADKIDSLVMNANETIDHNYMEALELYHFALSIANSSEDVEESCNVHFLLGSTYVNYSQDFTKGLSHLTNALELVDDENWILKILRQIGFVSNINGYKANAISYYQMALDLAKLHEAFKAEAEILSYIGEVYEEDGDMERALACYDKISSINSKNPDSISQPSIVFTLARLHILKEDTTTGLTAYDLMITRFHNENLRRWEAYTYSQKAAILLAMHQHEEALIAGTVGLNIASKYNLLKEKSDNLSVLVKINTAKKDFEQAFLFSNLLNAIADSVYSADKAKMFNDLKNQLAFIESQKEISKLEKAQVISDAKIKNHNTIIIAIGISAAYLILVGIYWWRRKSKEASKLETLVESRTNMLSTTLEHLEYEHASSLKLQSMIQGSQMSPHFIFNSLNSMQFYILDQEVQPALSYLSEFSKLLRTVQTNGRQHTITLEQEVLFLEQYLKLERSRFSEKFDFSIQISDDLEEDELLPPLLIQH